MGRARCERICGQAVNSQATDGAAEQRRELIALYAAKTSGLDGIYARRFVRFARDRLVLRPQLQASGIELPLEKSIRLGFLREAWPGLILLSVSAVTAISVPHFWIQSLFIAVIGLTFSVSLAFAAIWGWREKIRTAWSTMLPEVGSPIRVDSKCLTVGGTSILWRDVRLKAVEVRYLWQPRINPIYRVNQLQLATTVGPLVLDVRLIKNGQEVIDTICDKLEVKPAAVAHMPK